MNKQMVLFNPSSFFKHPKDLIDSNHLTREEKIIALTNWKQDSIYMQASVNEGMLEKESSVHLSDIINCLIQIEK